ncbi:MAG: HAD family phosphatase [Actinomycetota bacterium]|nr:HAD family phosphatase [Actinomycetota bacterium]
MTPATPAAAKKPPFASTESRAAVVFDADGVLVDTQPAWTAARRALFHEYGRRFGEAERRKTLGTGISGTCEYLSALLGEADLQDEKGEKLLALLCAQVSMDPPHPLPGAAELLEELHGERPMGVASNSPRAVLERSLEAAGLDRLLDAVVGVDEVANAKPAPDLYLAAVARLDCEPAQSIAIEDSPAGVASARSAGLYVIGVQSRVEVMPGGDQVVRSLTDARLRSLLGLPASQERHVEARPAVRSEFPAPG